jgi:hypothetical protein
MTAEKQFFENVHNLDEQWSAAWRSLWEARSEGDGKRVARCADNLRRLYSQFHHPGRQEMPARPRPVGVDRAAALLVNMLAAFIRWFT